MKVSLQLAPSSASSYPSLFSESKWADTTLPRSLSDRSPHTPSCWLPGLDYVPMASTTHVVSRWCLPKFNRVASTPVLLYPHVTCLPYSCTLPTYRCLNSDTLGTRWLYSMPVTHSQSTTPSDSDPSLLHRPHVQQLFTNSSVQTPCSPHPNAPVQRSGTPTEASTQTPRAGGRTRLSLDCKYCRPAENILYAVVGALSPAICIPAFICLQSTVVAQRHA